MHSFQVYYLLISQTKVKTCFFSIGASSLIGEEESAQSELVDGLVPAQSSEASSPKLLSVTAENNTVEFIVDLPEQNQKCQVKVALRYNQKKHTN